MRINPVVLHHGCKQKVLVLELKKLNSLEPSCSAKCKQSANFLFCKPDSTNN